MKCHDWTEQDDIAVLYLYKFGSLDRTAGINTVSKKRGMSVDSLRMRIGNFRSIDTGSGLDHYAQQSQSVHQRYGNLSSRTAKARRLMNSAG